MRKPVTCWIRGDEDMAEWHEKISDEFFEYVKILCEEAAKASKELHEIIDSSDPLMCSWRVKGEEVFVV